jgi:uncharacterized membrane protein YhaH (DUF805 family)
LIKLLAVFMVFVALKQFTGYSKRRLFWYMFLALSLIFVVLFAIGSLVVFLVFSQADKA